MTALAERMTAAAPESRVSIIDPTADPRWDEFVDRHPLAGPFHHSSWARVLIDSYGYRPRFHVLDAGGVIQSGWPAMLVRSRLTGDRLVTMPFSDYCPPLIDSGPAAAALSRSVLEDAASLRAKRVEVRGWPSELAPPSGFVASHGYVRHVVDLSLGLDGARSNLSENARRSLKKSRELGVAARLIERRSDFELFLALNLKLRRKHGMLPQPAKFFDAIWRHLIEPGRGYVLLAEHERQPLAALLCLRHQDVTLDKFAVNDETLQRFRGSHAATWSVIEREIERGARWYDMGRSDASAEGLHRFKAQFGGQVSMATYYYYPARGGAGTEDPKGPRKMLLDTFARVAPDPLFKLAGALAYGHLG